jgi:hypothetical protein
MDNTVLLMWIADIAGVCGMFYFLWAEVKQLLKIRKSHKITGISHTAYTSKLKAIIFTGVMLTITTMYMSFAVIIAEGIIVVWVLMLMKKYRRHKK